MLKIIDVMESYPVDRPDNKICNQQFPRHINVFKLPELFTFFAMVFGKLKDEKDAMMEAVRESGG